MKIAVKDFKGMVPKIASRGLQERYGQQVTNARLLSGDLEPYKGTTDVLTLGKTGPVNTIFPIDRTGINGGPYWLHWQDSEASTGVEVARGFNRDEDGQERVYFTGTDRPRVTNRDYAITGGGSSYPITSYYLGLPAPTTTLTAVTEAVFSAADFDLDGTSINDFTKGGGDGATIAASGTEIQLATTGQTLSTAWLTKDVGYSVVQFSRLKVRCRSITAASNSLSAFVIAYGFGNDSDGGRLFITQNSGTGEIRYSDGTISLSPTDPNNSPIAKSYTSGSGTTSIGTTVGFGTAFDVQIDSKLMDVIETSDGTRRLFEVTTTFFTTGGTQIATVTRTNVVLNGGQIRLEAAAQVDSSDVPVGGTNKVGYDNVEVYLTGEADTSSFTNYVYTFVNKFGEESAPSQASNNVIAGQDLQNTLTGFSVAGVNANYGVIGYRLYRAVTGTIDTQYQFVRTIDYTTVDGIDDVLPSDTSTWTVSGETLDDNLDEELEGVLESIDWLEPPQDARNIVALPNGIMVVSSGNLVCPSAQFRPHAYPEAYRLPTDTPIVAMSAIENSAIVMTEDATYIVVGSDPSSMSMEVLSGIYACVSKRSVAKWKDLGIVYASKKGLVVITRGGLKLITEGFISEKEFTNYYPDTINGVVYDDIYFGTYYNGATYSTFSYDLRNNELGFVDIQLSSTANYVDSLSELLYVVQNSNELKTWNTGSNLTYTWKSKDFLLPYPTSFECAQLKARDPDGFSTVTIKLYKDQSGTPFFTKTTTTDLEFILPTVICREFEFQLEGTARVSQFSLSTDMMELD